MIDELDMFRAIADGCSADECVEIMTDCLESDSVIMQTDVYRIYENRLNQLKKLELDIEHYQDFYDKN